MSYEYAYYMCLLIYALIGIVIAKLADRYGEKDESVVPTILFVWFWPLAISFALTFGRKRNREEMLELVKKNEGFLMFVSGFYGASILWIAWELKP